MAVWNRPLPLLLTVVLAAVLVPGVPASAAYASTHHASASDPAPRGGIIPRDTGVEEVLAAAPSDRPATALSVPDGYQLQSWDVDDEGDTVALLYDPSSGASPTPRFRAYTVDVPTREVTEHAVPAPDEWGPNRIRISGDGSQLVLAGLIDDGYRFATGSVGGTLEVVHDSDDAPVPIGGGSFPGISTGMQVDFNGDTFVYRGPDGVFRVQAPAYDAEVFLSIDAIPDAREFQQTTALSPDGEQVAITVRYNVDGDNEGVVVADGSGFQEIQRDDLEADDLSFDLGGDLIGYCEGGFDGRCLVDGTGSSRSPEAVDLQTSLGPAGEEVTGLELIDEAAPDRGFFAQHLDRFGGDNYNDFVELAGNRRIAHSGFLAGSNAEGTRTNRNGRAIIGTVDSGRSVWVARSGAGDGTDHPQILGITTQIDSAADEFVVEVTAQYGSPLENPSIEAVIDGWADPESVLESAQNPFNPIRSGLGQTGWEVTAESGTQTTWERRFSLGGKADLITDDFQLVVAVRDADRSVAAWSRVPIVDGGGSPPSPGGIPIVDPPPPDYMPSTYTDPDLYDVRVEATGLDTYDGVVADPRGVDQCLQPGDPLWTIGPLGPDDVARGTATLVDPSSCATQAVGADFVLTIDEEGGTVLEVCPDGAGGCAAFDRLSESAIFIGGGDPLDVAENLVDFLLALIESSGAFQGDRERVIYLATDETFPDALATGGVVGAQRALMILADPDDRDDNTAAVQRLRADRLVVVGGTAAIPEEAVPEGVPSSRIGGLNRFDTAALLSQSTFQSGVERVYVATGRNFPDALAGGAQASIRGFPVLLVDGERMPDETAAELQRLQPGEIVVLGGNAVIPDTILAELEGFTAGPVRRLAGANRIETATATSQDGFPDGADSVLLANAEDFRNPLVAAGNAWVTGSPLILTTPSTVPGEVTDELRRLGPDDVVVVSDRNEFDPVVKDTIEETAADIATGLSGP